MGVSRYSSELKTAKTAADNSRATFGGTWHLIPRDDKNQVLVVWTVFFSRPDLSPTPVWKEASMCHDHHNHNTIVGHEDSSNGLYKVRRCEV